MKYKAVTLGFVLAGTALGSAALTLGRARGAAWIGQPLELVVPVQVESGQADGGLCAEADVFHGDSRQDGNRVQVQVSSTDQPDTFNLKISSSALIDEPVVSVYLRAGCTQKSSRKFVLLADFPSDTTAAPSRIASPAAPQVPTIVPTEAPQGASSAVTTPTANPALPPKTPKVPKHVPQLALVTKSAAKELPAEPVKEVAKAPAAKIESPTKADKPATAQASARAESSGKPRLRLDPIETLSERVKTLESTTTGSSLQGDLARDSQKLQQLQGDLRALLDQATKNEAALVAMRERMEKAETERVPMAVVYGLLALVLLAMGALAFLWSKRPRSLGLDNRAGPTHGPAEAAAARAPGGAAAAKPDIDLDLMV